jgi:monovalent cation/hydrogen antiporter
MYDITGLAVLVFCGVAVVLAEIVAKRTGFNGPVLLIVGGVALGFLPFTSTIRVPPELVVLLFLPALLYWEALTVSLREIRNDLRTLVLSSVFLVIATAAAVAATAHLLLGLSWPVGFVLGAIVAPTDATAVAAVARGLPRRPLTMLRAESLVNDGTALVVFGLALGVATGAEPFRVLGALEGFAVSYLGGIVVGLVVAWLAIVVRRLARDPLVESTVSVLTPFVAFLLAEEIDASGVLGVVVCGLALGRVGPRSIGARTRVQAHAFWRITTFLLNATLFLLVGLELPAAVAGFSSRTLGVGVLAALLVAAAVILTRLVWLNVVPYLIRAVDRRASQRARRMSARQRLPLAWSGFRGAVSLAIALAVPLTTVDGAPFPERDLLLVVTFGVILVTLLVQGLTLPAVIRFARYAPDVAADEEMALAHTRTLDGALAILPRAAADHGASDALVDQLRAEHESRRRRTGAVVEEERRRADDDVETAIRLALVRERRRVLVQLRDDGLIDDEVVFRVQAELDNEELGLTGAPGPE